MILGQIAWSDCFIFLLFLAPQLIIHVGLIRTAACAIRALPFLVAKMPYQLVRERLRPRSQRSPFVQQATLFQDIVVFFSKGVALPFFRFRMLRNGVLRCPIFWKEVNREGLKGLYMIDDETRRPDIVIYYAHGGGFSMGSSYFYIEFLMAWVHMLKAAGYSNPALFALEYTLVPEATYPTQTQEALAGYRYVLSIAPDPSRIVVSGDSAGATVMLSLLLCLSKYTSLKDKKPGFAVMISPWATIISDKNQNTPSDYLNAESLRLYGGQYIGTKASPEDAMVSPGHNKDIIWWRKASPTNGWFFIHGAEEVFAPETRDLIALLRSTGSNVVNHEERGWVHAWPVVKLFLCNNKKDRLSGLERMTEMVKERIPRTTAN